jgi:hypothetical protein
MACGLAASAEESQVARLTPNAECVSSDLIGFDGRRVVMRTWHSGRVDTPQLHWKERYKRNVARMRSGLPDRIELVMDALTEREAS